MHLTTSRTPLVSGQPDVLTVSVPADATSYMRLYNAAVPGTDKRIGTAPIIGGIQPGRAPGPITRSSACPTPRQPVGRTGFSLPTVAARRMGSCGSMRRTVSSRTCAYPTPVTARLCCAGATGRTGNGGFPPRSAAWLGSRPGPTVPRTGSCSPGPRARSR